MLIKQKDDLDNYNFYKNIEVWNPTQEDIDKVILSYEELIQFTIEDCGDCELAQEYQEELKLLKINTFEAKQEGVKDYIRHVYYCTPTEILLKDEHLKDIVGMLIQESLVNDAE